MPNNKLAIYGGEKTVKKEFPWPIFDNSEINAVEEAIRSDQWGDPDCSGNVAEFEREFAKFCGTKFGAAMVNGSVALRVALIASGVKPGEEVIVPPYTFYATASIVIEVNCVPVFVDIEPDTYNINPEKIKKAITKKTKAIIPVHFGGQACNMDRIMEIARKNNLAVIEDACHAHGAEYKGQKLGSIGDVGVFSFQSSKNLTSGEGGIAITNDEKLFDIMNSLRNTGRVKSGEWYEHQNLGCNYRLTSIQAVLLLEQLKRLDSQTRKRNENGLYLNELLSEIDGISPLTRGHGESLHSYHLYIFRYDKSKFNNIPKKEFCKILEAEGVPCFMGYPRPLYKQPVFLNKSFFCYVIPENVDYSKVCCPVCEKACDEGAIWIMQSAMLGEKEDMELFAKAIKKIQENSESYII